MIFVVQNMAHYNELTRELFFGNPDVKRFKTYGGLSRDKVVVSIPVQESASASNRSA